MSGKPPFYTNPLYRNPARVMRSVGISPELEGWINKLGITPMVIDDLERNGGSPRKIIGTLAGGEIPKEILERGIVKDRSGRRRKSDTTKRENRAKLIEQDEQALSPDIDPEGFYAQKLGLSRSEFLDLREKAESNKKAYLNYRYYGQGGGLSFKVAAEAPCLPKSYEKLFEQLGSDILQYSKALSRLEGILSADEVPRSIPLMFRIDAILVEDNPDNSEVDKNSSFKIGVNEMQTGSGFEAGMSMHECIYNGKTLENTSPAYFIEAIRDRLLQAEAITKDQEELLILYVWNMDGWDELEADPYKPDYESFFQMVSEVSKGQVRVKLVPSGQLSQVSEKPDGVVIGYNLKPEEVARQLKVQTEQVISSSTYTSGARKSDWLPLFDPKFNDYFLDALGDERLQRLRDLIIPCYEIKSEAELRDYLENDEWVVKVARGPEQVMYGGAGVFGKWNREKNNQAQQVFENGALLIAQPFYQPAQFSVYTSRGTSLAKQTGGNRVCVRYFVIDEMVFPSAYEMTIGPGDSDKPSIRGCCFTGIRWV